MKSIFLFVLLLYQFSVLAQTDEDSEEDNSPAWTTKLPDRNDAPELNLDEEGVNGDPGGLTMDRNSLFNNESQMQPNQPEDDELDILNSEQEKQAEAARIVEQEKLAEAVRIVEQEKQAEAVRKAEQEKQAEADKIANQQKAIEDQKRAEEKRVTEENRLQDEKNKADLAVQKAQETENNIDVLVNDQPLEKVEAKQPELEQTYSWNKVVNILPEYPVSAARDKKEGWVEVEFTIDNNGNVIGAHPGKSYRNMKTFNKAALTAVRQWKFEPPINYGIRLNQTKSVRVVFNLEK